MRWWRRRWRQGVQRVGVAAGGCGARWPLAEPGGGCGYRVAAGECGWDWWREVAVGTDVEMWRVGAATSGCLRWTAEDSHCVGGGGWGHLFHWQCYKSWSVRVLVMCVGALSGLRHESIATVCFCSYAWPNPCFHYTVRDCLAPTHTPLGRFLCSLCISDALCGTSLFAVVQGNKKERREDIKGAQWRSRKRKRLRGPHYHRADLCVEVRSRLASAGDGVTRTVGVRHGGVQDRDQLDGRHVRVDPARGELLFLFDETRRSHGNSQFREERARGSVGDGRQVHRRPFGGARATDGREHLGSQPPRALHRL